MLITLDVLEVLLLTIAIYGLADFLHRRRLLLALRRFEKFAKVQRELAERLDGVVERVDRDGLTGAYSRSAGERRLNEALRIAPTIIIWIDVDDFGEINKAHGWGEGDELLRELSGALLKRFRRAHDTVSRYGDKADEFMIAVPVLVDDKRDGDPVYRMRQWAEGQISEIRADIAASFTYGICATNEVENPRLALHEAQDQVRAAKEKRKALRAADAAVPKLPPIDATEEVIMASSVAKERQ